MLRDAKNQYPYHLEFHEWSKTNLYPLRLHWVVSDGTQALTLIQGGCGGFWWEWYEFANGTAPKVPENRTARFESHRATAAAYTHFKEFHRAEVALDTMETLLSEDPGWSNREFATITWYTLLVEFYGAQDQVERTHQIGNELIQYLDDWLGSTTNFVGNGQTPLLGSWEYINGDWLPPSVAVHNAACAFAKAKEYGAAEQLFRRMLKEKPIPTPYGEALFLLACWENRHNIDEIRNALNSSAFLTYQDLQKFTPSLAAVLENNQRHPYQL
jgi:pentatricopeptide repeat protein